MFEQNVYAVDLRGYDCPQLFVQFKWQLKSKCDHACVIRFSYDEDQDINDILKYLASHKIQFSVEAAENNKFIEVRSTHV
ncbi:hypothetical protein N474_02220 [Pseudoalteromonas luteoviolacea CPMOR-2]|uniref:Uncharacterized protein n=2 Tax=Pseudoalteromonas luteoviolacea TaxID=43657 RepID=A0A166V4G0_9GAMM|nr:hypothetical protein N475_04400 [Pseudoalteromonas luteoviolacea DSM 6061]KZN54561.1 hypothetical protein N474_02220 [Pseudoalteromonas luteoviolacea CPMOR-2]MBE0389038.1 hypothetical protein [Pseudoalteromonas luteoviolacea DSM 6061]